MQSLAAALVREQVGSVMQNEPLARHTTWKIGGRADLFVIPQNKSALAKAMRIVYEYGEPWRVLGRGSNLLVKDGGIRGVVFCMDNINHVTFTNRTVQAGGGYSLVKLSVLAAERGLSGLEFAGGIPGSVGGAVFMNAGAHRSEISHVLDEAEVLLETGEFARLTMEELQFRYRTSVLQGERRGIVTEALFSLQERGREEVMNLMRKLRLQRLSTQPLNLPCAGSVFRNPQGDHAARLIEQAGLKGYRVGGAQVSELHANFIVNTGQALAQDVLAIIAHCKGVVQERFDVELETEVLVVGED